ncbi:putative secondary alcohol dehydrogenase [Grosmannia clavigera kw1407]|uniref:Putative secondary alcohol dehydrogenase n=1 Tax=Grosmannia clavigera (strain kw1407 / UAMH 11150) TaxID=655863 RepID=F0XKV7_GROCL|nr:putative secondary alcohol dehydrogenase [Grosmannia clavigera kw1407]EFX01779.1 putative secondary alcohol dehydrogenase [Grosmannia clavigera kw1407]
MQAFRFNDVSTGLQLLDVPIPEPGPGQVLVAVKAAGLCHSDVHVLQGGGQEWESTKPLTLGHEVAGTIVKLGPSSSDSPSGSPFSVGDRVAVAQICQPTDAMDWTKAVGVGFDGGYAPYALAYVDHLCAIPDGVSFAQAAVATDSIATAYHAVVASAAVQPGSNVAILGLGGLGTNAVAVAAHLGAHVYGVDVNPDSYGLATRLGAVACAASIDAFQHVTLDAVIDFVGLPATVKAAVTAVRIGGTVALVGLGASNVEIPFAIVILHAVNIVGSIGASLDDLHKVFALIESGQLKPNISEIPFADIPKGLDDLAFKYSPIPARVNSLWLATLTTTLKAAYKQTRDTRHETRDTRPETRRLSHPAPVPIMSAEMLPISPARFAEAIQDLPLSSLHLKVLEIRNDIAHLDYSNEQLLPYAQGHAAVLDAGAATAADVRAQEFAQPDQDCIDAIRENQGVIERKLEQIRLVRVEVEKRGASWSELLGKEEVELQQAEARRRAETAASALTAAQAAATNGTNGTAAQTNGSDPWSDGTFLTGTIRNGVLQMAPPGRPQAPQTLETSQTGGRLTDEQLRSALEQQLRLDENDQDDIGMHL